MNIYVVLGGPLKRYGEGRREFQVEAGTEWRVADLISHLKIPEASYSFVSVNGVKVQENKLLTKGDKVTIFPLVSGG